MNKKRFIKSSIFLLIFLFLGILYFWISISSYQTAEDLYDFPIPKNAQLVYKKEKVSGYEWDKSSFENGIPFSYKIVIKQNGWKEEEREGGNTTYTKGESKINLLSDTDYIEISNDF
ncbi:hypothetical protein [Bacillus testis]|uniref:hypothetical protein n=1 Tax=Bacillus testis TaxID=1622072 RepID=UPI00067EFF36|nr:hypothetical protein [Bacillus testis]